MPIKKFWDAINKPLTNAPSVTAKKIASAVDAPIAQGRVFNPNNPLGKYEDFARDFTNKGRGFLAGAVESAGNIANDLTSPMGLASMGFPMMRPAKAAGGMINNAVRTIDVIEPSTVKQVAPVMDDVNSLIGDLQRNLSKIPSKGQRPSNAGFDPATLPPDMVPPGMEHIFNNNRAAEQASRIIDLKKLAETGDRITGKIRMPADKNVDVVTKMRDLDRARGKR